MEPKLKAGFIAPFIIYGELNLGESDVSKLIERVVLPGCCRGLHTEQQRA